MGRKREVRISHVFDGCRMLGYGVCRVHRILVVEVVDDCEDKWKVRNGIVRRSYPPSEVTSWRLWWSVCFPWSQVPCPALHQRIEVWMSLPILCPVWNLVKDAEIREKIAADSDEIIKLVVAMIDSVRKCRFLIYALRNAFVGKAHRDLGMMMRPRNKRRAS